MNEADYADAFKIIAAGNAKSCSMMAIKEARAGNAEKARELLDQADQDSLTAHRSQTDLLVMEAKGNPVPVNIILVHAQDHLTGAILTRDLAGELIEIQGLIAGRG